MVGGQMRIDYITYIVYGIFILLILGAIYLDYRGNVAEEKQWHEDNPGCNRMYMCMNDVCEVNDENKICWDKKAVLSEIRE